MESAVNTRPAAMDPSPVPEPAPAPSVEPPQAARPAPAPARPARAPELDDGEAIPVVGNVLARRDQSFWPVLVATSLAIAVSFVIGRSGRFTPGDDIGYYLGLVGGSMMLLLLLYPARKYVPALRNWGAVKYWFFAHMTLGILGPVLVLVHSTFHMRSTNAAVALICMLVVAGSGIVGRYFYTQVHRGLYGEKLSLHELRTQVLTGEADMRSKLHFVPRVEARLEAFQRYALADMSNPLMGAGRFLTLWIERRRAQMYCRAELRKALKAAARARGWDREKYKRRLRGAVMLVNEFLEGAHRVAQFTVFDRLLQLWHVAHVPLVYLLVISGIAHVVYVHMY